MSSELGALLIVERLCLRCLAEKAGLVPAAVQARVNHLATLVLIRRFDATCDGCRAMTKTYGV